MKMTVKSTRSLMDEEATILCPVSFVEARHLEAIEGENVQAENWKMKERMRMKTVSVALVMCLNIGVDPPDVVKV